MPTLVDPEAGSADFWYYGRIDATLWWQITLDFYDRYLPEDGLLEQPRSRGWRVH